jgi:cation transport ATPase
MGNEQTGAKIGSRTLARAAALGLVISDPDQFELAADIDVILLSKAGTLTAPIRRVVKSRLAYGSPLSSQAELLAFAAAIELEFDHPLAVSVVVEARTQNLEIPSAVDVRSIPGQGVSGIIDGEAYFVGGPALLTAKNIPIYVDDLVRSDSANQLGHTVLYVVHAAQLLGMIELSETVFPQAAELVNKFHELKIRVAMVTGDATGVADHVAKQLNIAEIFAEVSPYRKADIVRKLKSDGSKVAVVGRLDLESLALAEAQVGIAIDSDGTSKSTAAGLHLNNPNLENLLKVIILSKRAKSVSTQKVLAIFAAAIFIIGLVVVLVSPK